MNRNDVIDVLTAISAADRRSIGQADVDVWQAIVGELPREIALQAVRDHLKHRPGVWMEPGHVYEGSRAILRDRLDRESNSQREARQAALDARFAGVDELAESKRIPIEPKYRRGNRNAALEIRCPWCHAMPGSRCTVPGTNERPENGIHPSRIEAAA